MLEMHGCFLGDGVAGEGCSFSGLWSKEDFCRRGFFGGRVG